MALRLLPDIEALTVAFLRGQADVAGIVGDNVSTQDPADAAAARVRIQRLGGTARVAGHLDGARIQIDCYAATKPAAERLAATVRMALLDEMPGIHAAVAGTHDGGIVTGVDERLGPTWSGDPTSGEPRYVSEVEIYAHPLPAGA